MPNLLPFRALRTRARYSSNSSPPRQRQCPEPRSCLYHLEPTRTTTQTPTASSPTLSQCTRYSPVHRPRTKILVLDLCIYHADSIFCSVLFLVVNKVLCMVVIMSLLFYTFIIALVDVSVLDLDVFSYAEHAYGRIDKRVGLPGPEDRWYGLRE